MTIGDGSSRGGLAERPPWIGYPNPVEHWMRGHAEGLTDFVEAIAQERQPVSDADLARGTVAVMYVGYLSAATGPARRSRGGGPGSVVTAGVRRQAHRHRGGVAPSGCREGRA